MLLDAFIQILDTHFDDTVPVGTGVIQVILHLTLTKQSVNAVTSSSSSLVIGVWVSVDPRCMGE